MPVAKAVRAKEYLARLRELLPEKKVSHCVFVAEYLSSFITDLGIDHDDAVAAGLLHDLCREIPPEDLLHEARERRIPISEVQLEKPLLLHGAVAAERCREEFAITDDIYEAIYWHTTGKPGLSLLGRGLILADFAEPTRSYPQAAEARLLLRKEGFEQAIAYVAEQKLRFSRSKPITDPNTAAFLLWLQRAAS